VILIKTKLERINNKLFLEIPESILNDLDISLNDEVSIRIENGNIVITKEEKELTVEDRLNIYSSKNLIKKYDWGKV
jgi:antitoxin component of MazEF toxin-antitoxin module